MGKLVQDEAGQIFVDNGGGVLTPVSEEQAALYQRGAENPVAGAAMAANEGIKGLAQGLLGLGSDEYKQQALDTQKNNQALSLAQPMAGGAGQYLPQAVIGATTAGAGILPTMGVEGLIGAASNPENPLTGAAFGAGFGLLGELAPGAVGWAGNKARNVELPFGIGKPKDPLMANPDNAGWLRESDAAPMSSTGQPAKPPPASQNPPDFSPSPPNMGPQQPPDPLALLRERVAAQDRVPRGRTAAQGPSDQGELFEGDFIEGAPGAPEPPPSMAERVTESLKQADAESGGAVAGTRVMEGTMTPDELAVYGVGITPGQRALLSASATDDAAGATAREMMGREAAQASQPFGGQGIRNVHDAQQQAATNFLTRELGLPKGINLTDPVLADITTQLGNGFDDMAKMMGNVPITPEIRNELGDILEYSRLSNKDHVQRLVDQLDQFTGRNGGNLTGEDWLELRTKINKMAKAGQKNGDIGQIGDAAEIMETLTKAMEGSLPDAAKAELRQMRHQYALAMNLFKPGARNIADGLVNPLSFYNKWNQGRSVKTRGQDPVGRFMNTMVTLTQKRMPDSGTAGRLLEAAAQLPLVGGIARGVQTARNL